MTIAGASIRLRRVGVLVVNVWIFEELASNCEIHPFYINRRMASSYLRRRLR